MVLMPHHSNPGCNNAEAALNTVLAECKYPEELWRALGKPLAMEAVEELIEAAAVVDPSFQKQVQTIWETGAFGCRKYRVSQDGPTQDGCGSCWKRGRWTR